MSILNTKKKLLMIPGPSEVYPEVLAVLSRPPMAHYGKDWIHIYDEVVEDAKKIFATREEVMLLPGLGHAALELAIINLTEVGDKVLICHNGFFGGLIEEIAQAYRAITVKVEAKYGKPINPEMVKEKLEVDKEIKAVFVVHNETSTGVLNPIQEISKVVKSFGKFLVVDSISAFGGIEIEMDEWKFDICIGYPSKALGGVHGVVPIAISREVWEFVERRKTAPSSRFMNLLNWRREDYIKHARPQPTSMPTNIVVALGVALKLALQEGLQNRYERHKQAGEGLRKGIRAMGLEVLAEEDFASPTVSAIKGEPEDLRKVIEILYEKYNIQIAAGLGKMADKVIRIGHMGLTANYEYILQTLTAIATALHEIGYGREVFKGAMVAAEHFTKLTSPK